MQPLRRKLVASPPKAKSKEDVTDSATRNVETLEESNRLEAKDHESQ